MVVFYMNFHLVDLTLIFNNKMIIKTCMIWLVICRIYMELKDYIEATSGIRIAMPQELASATALEVLISKISGINGAGCLPIDEPKEGKNRIFNLLQRGWI
jgi:uncharacterized membrane protein